MSVHLKHTYTSGMLRRLHGRGGPLQKEGNNGMARMLAVAQVKSTNHLTLF